LLRLRKIELGYHGWFKISRKPSRTSASVTELLKPDGTSRHESRDVAQLVITGLCFEAPRSLAVRFRLLSALANP